MNLSDIQQEAWQTAEEKGLHANLDGVTSLGTREQTLMHLMPVYAALNQITQYVKRHGVSSETCECTLTPLIIQTAHCLKDFTEMLMVSGRAKLDVDATNTIPATLIRLVLTHTEIDECAEVVRIGNKEKIADELADILIRIADLAECLNINLGDATEKKLAFNKTRKFGYGTPLERNKIGE